MLYRIVKFLLLSELVDVKSQLRFQIASFVFVNDVHFSQLIQHLCNAWVHCNCFCFIDVYKRQDLRLLGVYSKKAEEK